jgi:hypothetical protein
VRSNLRNKEPDVGRERGKEKIKFINYISGENKDDGGVR